MQRAFAIAAVFVLSTSVTAGQAAEVKILTAGAMKAVVLELVPIFEKETGHKAVVDNDTAGGLSKRILGGEAFDLVVVTPGVIDDLTGKGKVAAGRTVVARVGVGVAVKEGAPLPDISSVEALRRALLAARSVAYIDPASGGSSGPFVVGLFEKLGITSEMKPKTKRKNGGYVADLVASGEAELGLHQISEIMPVKGVRLAGPLPAEIQNYTTYAAGVAADAKQADAARVMIRLLSGPEAADVLKRRGMEKPPA